MFKYKRLTEEDFNKLTSWFGYNRRMKLQDVDFYKPWWYIFWQQKWLVLINILNQAYSNTFLAIIPVAISYSFQQRSLFYFVLCTMGLLIFRISSHALFYFDPMLRTQIAQSMIFSANKFFLQTDPINHSSRSSGQIIAKINRGANSMENFVGIMSFELISLFFGMIATVGIFSSFGLVYGVVVFVSLSALVIFNIFAFLFKKQFEHLLIKYDDDAQSVNIETLNQVQFIRSVFGSNEQLLKMRRKNFLNMYTDATSWRISGYIITFTQIIFFLSLGMIGYLMLGESNYDPVITSSLIISYFYTGSRFYFFGHNIKQLIKSYVSITDLFKFIRNFGKQSYPVVSEDK
jgi:hypothetical protein